jgi:hypothetical protein
MKHTIVRYKVRPDRIDENQRLVRAVFSELAQASTEGLHYAAIADGEGNFFHIVRAEDGTESPTDLASFERFRSGIGERCLVLPESSEFTIVGNFRMLSGI